MRKLTAVLILFTAFIFAYASNKQYDECVAKCRAEMKKCRDSGRDVRRCLDDRNDCVDICRDQHKGGERSFKKK